MHWRNNALIHNMRTYSGYLRLLTNTKPWTLPGRTSYVCLKISRICVCVRMASTISCVHSCETKCTVSTLMLRVHAESFWSVYHNDTVVSHSCTQIHISWSVGTTRWIRYCPSFSNSTNQIKWDSNEITWVVWCCQFPGIITNPNKPLLIGNFMTPVFQNLRMFRKGHLKLFRSTSRSTLRPGESFRVQHQLSGPPMDFFKR